MIYILIWNIIILQTINSFEIIRGSKILLSSNMNFSIPKNNKCKEIVVPNNFKKLRLYLISNEINELLITDYRINLCQSNQSISDCCDNNSTFCMRDINPVKNFYQLYACLNETYVYACGNNKNEPSYLIIKTYVVKEQGCEIEEYNDEIECANIGLSECKSHTTKCQYVECFSDKNVKLFGLCVPSNFTDEDINQRCYNHASYNENGFFIKQINN